MPKFLKAFCIMFPALFSTVSNASAHRLTNIDPQNKKPSEKNILTGKSQFTYVMSEAQGGFGYNILKNNSKIIHQSTIPGVSGNNEFTAKEDAVKAAKLVIKNLENNIMLPAINRHDLDPFLLSSNL